MPCQGCGLPDDYCACDDAFSTPLPLQLALLLHENEPARPSNTSRLIKQQLPATQQFIWQRTVPPTELLHLLQRPRAHWRALRYSQEHFLSEQL